MDETQKKIAKALKDNRDCLKDMTMLKNVLADAIPNDKIHSNLIIEAYTEGVFKCFFENDPTLSLLKFIPKLVNDYGVSEENAVWSVVTWCYVFSRVETAAAIMNLNIGSGGNDSAIRPLDNSNSSVAPLKGKIDMGVYKAGIDIPTGSIRIKIEMDMNVKCLPSIAYGVGKKPDEIDEDTDIETQFYVNLEKGDYISLRSYGDKRAILSVTYEKVGD